MQIKEPVNRPHLQILNAVRKLPSRNYSVFLEFDFLFRPKGPAVQIDKAIGPGSENEQTLKAQRADSSIPIDGI